MTIIPTGQIQTSTQATAKILLCSSEPSHCTEGSCARKDCSFISSHRGGEAKRQNQRCGQIFQNSLHHSATRESCDSGIVASEASVPLFLDEESLKRGGCTTEKGNCDDDGERNERAHAQLPYHPMPHEAFCWHKPAHPIDIPDYPPKCGADPTVSSSPRLRVPMGWGHKRTVRKILIFEISPISRADSFAL
eukprot:2435075-Prymnesium_polylepis.1